MGATDGRAGRPAIDRPVACVIRVRGALAPTWADRVGGLRVGAADDGATSELRGELPDQTALLEVLTTLYDLGYPLLAVACEPR
jgi:hypothetical protein